MQVKPTEGAGAARKPPSDTAELTDVTVTAVPTRSRNK